MKPHMRDRVLFLSDTGEEEIVGRIVDRDSRGWRIEAENGKTIPGVPDDAIITILDLQWHRETLPVS